MGWGEDGAGGAGGRVPGPEGALGRAGAADPAQRAGWVRRPTGLHYPAPSAPGAGLSEGDAPRKPTGRGAWALLARRGTGAGDGRGKPHSQQRDLRARALGDAGRGLRRRRGGPGRGREARSRGGRAAGAGRQGEGPERAGAGPTWRVGSERSAVCGPRAPAPPRPLPGSGARPPHDRSGRARPSRLRKARLAGNRLPPPPGATRGHGGARGGAGPGAARCWRLPGLRAPPFRRPSGPKPAQRSPSLGAPGPTPGAPGQGEQNARQRNASPSCALARGGPAAGMGPGRRGGGGARVGGRALQNPLLPACLQMLRARAPPQAINTPAARPRLTLPQPRLEQQDPHNRRADVPRSCGECPEEADGSPTLAVPQWQRGAQAWSGLKLCRDWSRPFPLPRGNNVCVRGVGVSQAEGTAGGEGFPGRVARPAGPPPQHAPLSPRKLAGPAWSLQVGGRWAG